MAFPAISSFVEFRDKDKCEACQSRERDCIMKPGTDACLLCSDAGRPCIFERLMRVRGPASKFAWASLLAKEGLLDLDTPSTDKLTKLQSPLPDPTYSFDRQTYVYGPTAKAHLAESRAVSNTPELKRSPPTDGHDTKPSGSLHVFDITSKEIKKRRPYLKSERLSIAAKRKAATCDDCVTKKKKCHHSIDTDATRPFVCAFRRYGCSSRFGSKNEWKRHVASQHLCPGIYRCDVGACVPSDRTRDQDEQSTEKAFNEFNRKDLFTQHVRRMHGPGASASRTTKDAFEGRIESIRRRCWVPLRPSPPKSICPYCAHGRSGASPSSTGRASPVTKVEDKPIVFEGSGGWDERMEHVGRHLEQGNLGEEVEDVDLREWMRKEGLITWENGMWVVAGTMEKKQRRGTKGTKEVAHEAENGEDEDGDTDE